MGSSLKSAFDALDKDHKSSFAKAHCPILGQMPTQTAAQNDKFSAQLDKSISDPLLSCDQIFKF